ncbi:hypothetical protein BRC91_06500 [Halobacteriales archaeon QS_4_62_28]|nr:MAG: hypothetical protein BRC91_06500 [Halobacteriales archaeon QS_4_62_28]
MNTPTERFEDISEPLGIGVGVVLVLIGLGTVSGAPWATNGDIVASILQILGVILTMALGAGLAYVSWSGRE